MDEQNNPAPEPEQPAKKKLRDMSPDERREYQKLAKQRSRERQRLEQEVSEIPAADEYIVPEKWESELSKFRDETVRHIQAEIGPVTEKDKYVISGITEISLGLEKSFTQRVEFPKGILVGMWFPEALGAEAIRHINKNPALLQSPTFMDVYHRVLVQIAKWADTAPADCVNRESIAKIREELR